MESKTSMTRVADVIDHAHSQGRYSITIGEIGRSLDSTESALRTALRRLENKGRVASPRRGFVVIVPPEYRATGSPPASWFIDDLMGFLGQTYYVGLLTAASIHGSAHQQPQVFQVMTPKALLPITSGRVSVEFHRRSGLEQVETQSVKTETGFMRVSTPETTLFDLIRHPAAAGHLNNVATILAELAECVAPGPLAKAALVAHVTEVQRAGFLLELVGREDLAKPLLQSLVGRRVRTASLRPELGTKGAPVDSRWKLQINDTVEPDL